ncbi:MAG: T9SS type A sorting domain-containing protein [Saprospiraceae bacterium]
MKRFFLFLVFCILLGFSNSTFATHYMGSELTYECLGGNQYEVKLVTYTDCAAISPAPTLSVNFSSSCSSFNTNLSVVTGYPQEITAACPTNSTYCTGGTAHALYETVYLGTVTIPACADWIISHSSCCRNSATLNLLNPTSQSHYIELTMDNSTVSCNTSPDFELSPITVACVNDTSYHSFNAFDADGDSLVYSLTSSMQSAGVPTNYTAGFSPTSPISGSLSIDSKTGLLTIVPTMGHHAVFCVKVEEYRNGVKIGDLIREFQLLSMSCTNNLPKVQQINGGNIAFNSQHTATVGQTLSLDFSFVDTEVQAGTQSLTFSTHGNPNFNGTATNNTTYNVTFTPTINEVGTHFLTVYAKDDACPSLGENHYTVEINVLAISFITAIDDVFFGTENTPVLGNLVANDLSSSTLTVNTTPIQNPLNGTFTTTPNGDFIYTPNTGFTGIDSFDYAIVNADLLTDTATVYINIQPAPIPNLYVSDTIVLGASYPNYYCLTDSAYYLSDTLDNAVLTFVNDSCFSIYGDYLGTDTLTLASANEVVHFYITVENGVWPGDTDDDAFVNNVDLLNIGLAYGSAGVPRSQQSTLWNGYLVDDWTLTFSNGLNAKHADTNGDGMIDANDTMAIVQNWSLSYNKNGGRNGSPLYLETDSMTIVDDSLAYIPIMLGTVSQPVSNVYGLAFTINYNTTLVDDNSVKVRFHPSWLGINNTDMISISKDFYNNQLAEVAVTRIDGNPMSGNGQVGLMCFTIQDDIIRGGDSIFTFGITNVLAIDNNGMTVDLQGEDRDIDLVTISDIANNTQSVNLSNHLQVYPNPATDYLTVLATEVSGQAKAIKIESVEVFDMTGRKVLSEYSWNNRNQLNISNLNNGFYILHIKTDLGVWNEKITVMKP